MPAPPTVPHPAGAPPPPPPPPPAGVAYGPSPSGYGAPPPPPYPAPQTYYTPAPPQESIGEGLKIVFYLVSFFIPIIGFIIGIIYYTKPEPALQEVGRTCVVLALIGAVIACAAWLIL